VYPIVKYALVDNLANKSGSLKNRVITRIINFYFVFRFRMILLFVSI